MTTLGINPFSHDSSVTIVKDGIIIAAATQERFDRIKHSTHIPTEAIESCLHQCDITDINTINEISLIFNYSHYKLVKIVDDVRLLSTILKPAENKVFNSNSHLLNIIKTILILRSRLEYKGKISLKDHHDCHAASCYYPSNFIESAILTVDGRGEKHSTRIYKAAETKFTQLVSVSYPHSLGAFYASITQYLGFKQFCDEGKIMGLAPYGNNTYVEKMKKIIQLQDKPLFELNLEYFTFHKTPKGDVSEKFHKVFGPPRKKSEPIDQRHKDIAYAAQAVLEATMLHLAQKTKDLTQSENLCISGGVALNSVVNGKIESSKLFKNIYIYPAAGDEGASTGAALLSYYSTSKSQVITKHNQTPYLGYKASSTEIETTLKNSGLSYTQPENIYKKTAQLLRENKFVGWFHGNAEFGPRALGNRSILANPQIAENKDLLNARIKFRESFRPFAPSVMKEHAGKYFENCSESPYMIMTYNVLEEKRKEIPAVTHIDGTARVQTVTHEQNPHYYNLLSEFYQLTQTPILLNTSFNIMNEPIVNTPAEALHCFLNTGLDVLVLDTYLIIKAN